MLLSRRLWRVRVPGRCAQRAGRRCSWAHCDQRRLLPPCQACAIVLMGASLCHLCACVRAAAGSIELVSYVLVQYCESVTHSLTVQYVCISDIPYLYPYR